MLQAAVTITLVVAAFSGVAVIALMPAVIGAAARGDSARALRILGVLVGLTFFGFAVFAAIGLGARCYASPLG